MFLPVSGALRAEEEEAIEFPNAKINRIDISNPPEVKVFITVLDRNKKVIKLKDIESVKLSIAKEKEKERVAVEFTGKKAKEPYKGTINSFAKLGLPFSFIVILAGHGDHSLNYGSLGARQKKGLEFFLKELPQENAKGNVIWYGDRLYSYIQKQSGSSELSDIERNRKKCATFLFSKFSNEKDVKVETECGLFADFKNIGKIIEDQSYEGNFPRLFSILHKKCLPFPKEPLWDKEIEDQDGNPQNSAFEEALKKLIIYGGENEEKAIFLFTDGMDGYLLGEDDCRIHLKGECSRGISDMEKIVKCVEDKVLAWKRGRQEIFREKLERWLALLKAAGIRVFSVGYPTGDESDLLRLEVLSLKTGGTYRFATNENLLAEYFKAAADEISEQLVVTFEPETEPGGRYYIRAEIKPERGSLLRTAAFGFTAEKPPWKVKRFFNEVKLKLEKKVGKTLSIVIIASVGIVAVLIAVLFTKLFIKLVKKIFKK